MEVWLLAFFWNYDKPTKLPINQPTDARTGRLIGKLHFRCKDWKNATAKRAPKAARWRFHKIKLTVVGISRPSCSTPALPYPYIDGRGDEGGRGGEQGYGGGGGGGRHVVWTRETGELKTRELSCRQPLLLSAAHQHALARTHTHSRTHNNTHVAHTQICHPHDISIVTFLKAHNTYSNYLPQHKYTKY